MVRLKKIKVEIAPREKCVKELIEVAKRIEKGEDVRYEKLVFESYEAFRKVMTPERLRILHVIKKYKPKSIYELAKILGRDRRNLMKDLEILEMLGLIEFSEEEHGKRKRKVPVINYDQIQVSIFI